MLDQIAIDEFCKTINHLGYSYSQENKIGKLRITLPLTPTPDHSIRTNFEKLPICYKVLVSRIKKGKSTENVNYYELKFVVTKPYFNNKLVRNTLIEEFIRFCDNNEIVTKEDFVKVTIKLMNDLNNYTHITKDRLEKRKLYSYKDRYFKWCINNQLTDKIEVQFNYVKNEPTPDKLYRITIGEYVMWVRAVNFFISEYNIPYLNTNYQAKEKYTVDSMDFMEYCWIFEHINLTELFYVTELL